MITIEKLLSYIASANAWLSKHKENNDTKLGYAMRKMIKQVNKKVEIYNELIEERETAYERIRINNAATSDTSPKVLLYDLVKDKDGNEVQAYKFTPAGKIKCKDELQAEVKKYSKKLEEVLSKEVELENPYYTTEVPDDLTTHEREVFTSIVIEPELQLTDVINN